MDGRRERLALAWGELPRVLARFGLGALVVAAAAIALGVRYARAELEELRMPSPAAVALFGLAWLCFPGWCVWLGLSL